MDLILSQLFNITVSCPVFNPWLFRKTYGKISRSLALILGRCLIIWKSEYQFGHIPKSLYSLLWFKKVLYFGSKMKFKHVGKIWPILTMMINNSWLDLTWSNLTGPDLTWPDLIWSDLTWNDLTLPDLIWPELTCPNLTWPDLTRPDMTWPYLTWSDLA